jgi:hypothetical protein
LRSLGSISGGTTLEGRLRKAAGFAVYLGFAPAVLEHVDYDPTKPSILLDAAGEPLTLFRTKAAGRAAIRRTREHPGRRAIR